MNSGILFYQFTITFVINLIDNFLARLKYHLKNRDSYPLVYACRQTQRVKLEVGLIAYLVIYELIIFIFKDLMLFMGETNS